MPDSSRSFWKGYLRLALVSIPVRLVSAERASSEIKFHQVDRVSKQRIRYAKTAPGRGEVAKEDIATAYEFEPGNYVFIEEDELDALKLPAICGRSRDRPALFRPALLSSAGRRGG